MIQIEKNGYLINGDSDIGGIVMLVTLWWLLIWDIGGKIIMLVFFRYVGDFVNVLNRSPTSWIGHQYIKFVTKIDVKFVTNIDVTLINKSDNFKTWLA